MLLFLQLSTLPGTDFPALAGLVQRILICFANFNWGWLQACLLTTHDWSHSLDSVGLIVLQGQ